MHILIAPDSFKDALSADKVAASIERGITKAAPEWACTLLPMADGGEGTLRIITNALKGQIISTASVDAMHRPIMSVIGWIPDRKSAIIELAAASGIQFLKASERHPLHTSTFGTGLLIKKAIEWGAKTIYLTLGGSATNDMGIGMAAALGYQFISGQQRIENPTGKDLPYITNILKNEVLPELKHVRVIALCDVNNSLYGKDGAAQIYGRQKGASEKEIVFLDQGLQMMSDLVSKLFNRQVQHIAGAGAAGGCGAGALVFLDATLSSGIEAILQLTGFRQIATTANIIITGEGSIDHQTSSGKVVSGVTNIGQELNIPVIGLCGICKLDFEEIKKLGLHSAFSISNGAISLEKALENTSFNLEKTSAQVASILKLSTR